MFKIIIMALLIFIGMVGYDNITDKAQPTTPIQQEQQKVSKHEKSAAMALFTSLLPPCTTSPALMLASAARRMPSTAIAP